MLGAVHAGDDVTRARITAATQPTASGEVDTGPGQALQTLVTIGRASLAHADPGVATHREAYGLTASWLDACAQLGDDALAAERSASQTGADLLGQQSRVDLWDGRNLALLERVVRAIARAHAIDDRPPAHDAHTRGLGEEIHRSAVVRALPQGPRRRAPCRRLRAV